MVFVIAQCGTDNKSLTPSFTSGPTWCLLASARTNKTQWGELQIIVVVAPRSTNARLKWDSVTVSTSLVLQECPLTFSPPFSQITSCISMSITHSLNAQRERLRLTQQKAALLCRHSIWETVTRYAGFQGHWQNRSNEPFLPDHGSRIRDAKRDNPSVWGLKYLKLPQFASLIWCQSLSIYPSYQDLVIKKKHETLDNKTHKSVSKFPLIEFPCSQYFRAKGTTTTCSGSKFTSWPWCRRSPPQEMWKPGLWPNPDPEVQETLWKLHRFGTLLI